MTNSLDITNNSLVSYMANSMDITNKSGFLHGKQFRHNEQQFGFLHGKQYRHNEWQSGFLHGKQYGHNAASTSSAECYPTCLCLEHTSMQFLLCTITAVKWISRIVPSNDNSREFTELLETQNTLKLLFLNYKIKKLAIRKYPFTNQWYNKPKNKKNKPFSLKPINMCATFMQLCAHIH